MYGIFEYQKNNLRSGGQMLICRRDPRNPGITIANFPSPPLRYDYARIIINGET